MGVKSIIIIVHTEFMFHRTTVQDKNTYEMNAVCF